MSFPSYHEISSHRIRLVLDAREVFPEDPGNGTPALVWIGEKSATYWCAQGEGSIEDVILNSHQQKWLDDQEDYVTDWCNYWYEAKQAKR